MYRYVQINSFLLLNEVVIYNKLLEISLKSIDVVVVDFLRRQFLSLSLSKRTKGKSTLGNFCTSVIPHVMMMNRYGVIIQDVVMPVSIWLLFYISYLIKSCPYKLSPINTLYSRISFYIYLLFSSIWFLVYGLVDGRLSKINIPVQPSVSMKKC